MSNNVKVSVIIPVFNTEKYVGESLTSALNQTLKEIEVICISDGSTDGSFAIMEEFAKKDPRVIAINNPPQGIGITRNAGLDIAKGEYIFFLDSDDYLKEDILEKLYNKMQETKSDIIISKSIAFTAETDDYTVTRNKNMNMWLIDELVENYQITPDNYMQSVQDFSCVIWGKLYSRKFFEDCHLRFINKRAIHEDNGFWMKVCSNCPKITTVEDIGVMYRLRHDSVTTNIDKKEYRGVKRYNMKMVLKDTMEYIEANFPKDIAKRLIKQIKSSDEYNSYYIFKIPLILTFNWLLNNKRIYLFGIPIFREKRTKDKKHKVGKLFGIPLYEKELTK